MKILIITSFVHLQEEIGQENTWRMIDRPDQFQGGMFLKTQWTGLIKVKKNLLFQLLEFFPYKWPCLNF